jgi:hypothetical protein
MCSRFLVHQQQRTNDLRARQRQPRLQAFAQSAVEVLVRIYGS